MDPAQLKAIYRRRLFEEWSQGNHALGGGKLIANFDCQ